MTTTKPRKGRTASLAERWWVLQERRQEAKAVEKEITDELAVLESQLIDRLAAEGIPALRIAAGVTIYTRTEQWVKARDGDQARAVEWLESKGMDDLLSVQHMKVRSYFRERSELGEPLPAGFDEVFEITEAARLGYRRSS